MCSKMKLTNILWFIFFKHCIFFNESNLILCTKFKKIHRKKSSKWQKEWKNIFHWIHAVPMVTQLNYKVIVAKTSNLCEVRLKSSHSVYTHRPQTTTSGYKPTLSILWCLVQISWRRDHEVRAWSKMLANVFMCWLEAKLCDIGEMPEFDRHFADDSFSIMLNFETTIKTVLCLLKNFKFMRSAFNENFFPIPRKVMFWESYLCVNVDFGQIPREPP